MEYRVNLIRLIFDDQSINEESFCSWVDQINLQLRVLFDTINELKEIGSVNKDGFELLYDTTFARFRADVIRSFRK